MSKSLYEVMFILDPEKVEGNGEAFDAEIQEQLKALGGEISRVKFFEKRRDQQFGLDGVHGDAAKQIHPV